MGHSVRDCSEPSSRCWSRRCCCWFEPGAGPPLGGLHGSAAPPAVSLVADSLERMLKVGFIGLGLMGSAMATRLVQAGHEVMVYNRTAAKLAPLVALGAQPAQSITAVAQHGAVVLSMLADDAALAAVACQPDGLLASLPRGGIHVAMGTHGVAAVEALEQAHRA